MRPSRYISGGATPYYAVRFKNRFRRPRSLLQCLLCMEGGGYFYRYGAPVYQAENAFVVMAFSPVVDKLHGECRGLVCWVLLHILEASSVWLCVQNRRYHSHTYRAAWKLWVPTQRVEQSVAEGMSLFTSLA